MPPRPKAAKKTTSFDAFYRAVRKIPKGRVCTYGVIATLAGKPRAARQVGFALGALRDPKTDIPWQRVLASKSARHAMITPRGGGFAKRQRELLEAEGVRFDAGGRVDLREFGWSGAAAATTTRSAPSRAASAREKRRPSPPKPRATRLNLSSPDATRQVARALAARGRSR